MDTNTRRELEWAAVSFIGSLAVVWGAVAVAGIRWPAYVTFTFAAVMAIVIDGWRFYAENAIPDESQPSFRRARPVRRRMATHRPPVLHRTGDALGSEARVATVLVRNSARSVRGRGAH